jgi:hypothetical protein
MSQSNTIKTVTIAIFSDVSICWCSIIGSSSANGVVMIEENLVVIAVLLIVFIV